MLRSILGPLLLVAIVGCSTTPRQPPARAARPSFDTQVFADVAACCTSCRAIVVSVRNPTDDRVVLDLSRARFSHNGERVALTFEGAAALIEIAPHTTWRGTLRPPAGAPNPASLKEGRFRNGHYEIALAVLQDPAAPTGPVEVTRARLDLDYAERLAQREGQEPPAECALRDPRSFSGGRPAAWPAPDPG